MKKLDVLAGVLVVVGALNWGLVAIAEFDLVATLFGLDFRETNAATRVVYGLVGRRSRLRGCPVARDAPPVEPHSGSRGGLKEEL